MSKFCFKGFKNLYFPSHMMDLDCIWLDDRYWSKVLFTTITIPAHDFKVKVTDLKLNAIFPSKSFVLESILTLT